MSKITSTIDPRTPEWYLSAYRFLVGQWSHKYTLVEETWMEGIMTNFRCYDKATSEALGPEIWKANSSGHMEAHPVGSSHVY